MLRRQANGGQRKNYQLRLAAAAHSIRRPRVERAGVILVTAWGARLYGHRLVSASDDRVIRIKRRVGAERDHKPGVLVRGHPDDLSSGFNTEELVVLRVGNTRLNVGRAAR